MKRIASIILILLTAFVALQCTHAGTDKKTISVTIPPLKGIVNQIVGDDYEVNVLLPAGTSPETYSPTISQLTAVSYSDFVFTVGTLNFEQTLANSLKDNAKGQIISTSEGVSLIEGTCGHAHHHDHESQGEHHNHQHGIDPHVWMSHKGLLKIIDNITDALVINNSDSVSYATNAERVKNQIKAQMSKAEATFDNAAKSFLIYHPALGYFAEEYGLEQISLENEGKNPTPKSLAEIVEKVNDDNLTVLLYQQEYPEDVVKPVADILGVNLFQINPLSEDIIAELDRVINILSARNE